MLQFALRIAASVTEVRVVWSLRVDERKVEGVLAAARTGLAVRTLLCLANHFVDVEQVVDV
jgi:hypothetical protein